MSEAYILKIDKNLNRDDFYRLLSCVSEEKKEKIKRYRFFEDSQRSILGDILARYAICKKTGLRNKDLLFRSNDYGKPSLVNLPELHFNISHSGNWVVCATDDHTVGIDVEVIRPVDLNIAERFFSRDECRSLIKQPEGNKLQYFYKLWTLKESYIKAEGKGLGIPLDSFSINIDGNNISIIGTDVNKNYSFYQDLLEDDAVFSICSLNNTISIIFFSIDQLLGFFKLE